MEEQTPIKRHDALISFSTEHQYLLLLLWKIRHGLSHSISADRISKYIIYAYNADVRPHFWDEEANLFNILRPHDPMRVQGESEHREIHEVVVRISKKTGDESLIRSFADLLEKHIRFEELTLFNYLQDQLSAEAIVKLLPRQPTDPDSKWPDLYWMEHLTPRPKST